MNFENEADEEIEKFIGLHLEGEPKNWVKRFELKKTDEDLNSCWQI